MIRMFEAFAGYGSQSMAMDRLGIDYEVVGISEIDRYAIKSYMAVHGETKNYGDISKIDWSTVPDFDFFTYSFPCQDISNAGLQRGLQEGSGTRSSLLWECSKAIEAKKPKYLMMENVKALTSDKFMPYLQKWDLYLSNLGYSNFTQVLNAKDYGVPQNRERTFMISILDAEEPFYFPDPFPLKLRLKNVLEDKVDEKYYLSEKLVDSFKAHCERKEKEGCGFRVEPTEGDCVAKTIQTLAGSRHTDNFIKEPISCAMRGRNPINPSDRRAGIETKQRIEIGDDIANCLTSVSKDSLVVEPQILQVGNIVGAKGWENPQRGRIYSDEGICPALNTVAGGGLEPKIVEPQIMKVGKYHSNFSSAIVQPKGISPTILDHKGSITAVLEPQFRIRKLTERECFRLMGVSDEDIDKIQASGISRSQQYKQAGNSIVVDVMYYIMDMLFNNKKNKYQQLQMF